MGIFLGDKGHVELRRGANNQGVRTALDPSDVNVSRKRFSVDFANGSLISGDQVTISTVDRSPLELVANHIDAAGAYYPDWRGFIHVDDAGGIRLYNDFSDSVTGIAATAVALVEPSVSKSVLIQTRDERWNCLAQVSSYELTTSRDNVATDSLGDEFRSYYEAGMVSGQGSLDCFWDHPQSLCDQESGTDPEFASYLARLVLRLKQGALFDGRFYIYAMAGQPSLWYETQCIVTNLALSVEPTQVVRTKIDFVVTGDIALHQGVPESYLLVDGLGNKLLQEDQFGILLNDDT